MQGQLVLVVHVDVAFLLNFLIDLVWLWLTSRLSGVRVSWWRLSLAAALGAAAVVWAYFPSGRWLLTTPGAVVGTLAFLGAAFWPTPLNLGLRTAAYLIFSGGIMSGIVMLLGLQGGRLRAAAGAVAWHFPSAMVATGIMLCLFGVRFLWRAAQERARLARGLYTVRVRVGEGTVEVRALLDTGNHLKDPLTGSPVAVVEAAALASILPRALIQATRAGWEGLERLPEAWISRCRLIPYRTVGQPAGVLIAFVADELAIRAPGRSQWQPVAGLVGAAGDPLHPEQVYQALLSPQLVDAM